MKKKNEKILKKEKNTEREGREDEEDFTLPLNNFAKEPFLLNVGWEAISETRSEVLRFNGEEGAGARPELPSLKFEYALFNSTDATSAAAPWINHDNVSFFIEPSNSGLVQALFFLFLI